MKFKSVRVSCILDLLFNDEDIVHRVNSGIVKGKEKHYKFCMIVMCPLNLK